MIYLKRLLLSLLVVGLVTLSIGQGRAAAHELKENNGVSAVLHVPPDDNPVSGKQTLLYFGFDSNNPTFNLAYCKCQVSFQASDNRQQTTPITPDSEDPTNGYANVTFEKPGAYVLKIRGLASDQPDDYFNFEYTLRVAAGATAAETLSRKTASLQVILLSVTALVILGAAASEMIRRGDHYGRKH